MDERIKLLRELLTAPANMYYEDHLLGCPPILLAVFLNCKESGIALLKVRNGERYVCLQISTYREFEEGWKRNFAK